MCCKCVYPMSISIKWGQVSPFHPRVVPTTPGGLLPGVTRAPPEAQGQECKAGPVGTVGGGVFSKPTTPTNGGGSVGDKTQQVSQCLRVPCSGREEPAAPHCLPPGCSQASPKQTLSCHGNKIPLCKWSSLSPHHSWPVPTM